MLRLEPCFVRSAGITANAIGADSQDPAETDQSEPDHTRDYGSSEGDGCQVVGLRDEGAFRSLYEKKSGHVKNWQRKSASLPYGPAYNGYSYQDPNDPRHASDYKAWCGVLCRISGQAARSRRPARHRAA
jgi:hypothetical protein